MKHVIWGLFLIMLVGCAGAKIIKETKDGGRVAAYGANGLAAEKAITLAHKKMATKCPQGYEVIEEGWQGSGVTSYGGGVGVEAQEKYFDFKCKNNN